MIDVSVVIPSHNRLPLLPATIDSVLGQRNVTLQLIVVDDGSTDGTGAWLGSLVAEKPSLTVVRHEAPRGPSSARNSGIARAVGHWTAFCDDDDLWAPDKLANQLAAFRGSPARWGCTSAVLVNARLDVIGYQRVKGGEVLSDLLQRNTIWSGSSVIAETSLLQELGGFDPTLGACEDWDLWIRLARVCPLAVVERPLLAHRQSSGSLSSRMDAMRNGHATVFARYRTLAQRGVSVSDVDYDRYLAKQLLRAGKRGQAASILARAFLEHRQWRDLLRAVTAAMAPRLTCQIGDRRAASAVPAAWKAEVDVWLKPFRERYAVGDTQSSRPRHPEMPGCSGGDVPHLSCQKAS